VVTAAADGKGDIHALDFLDLVEVDVRENRLLAQSHVVVAAAVKPASVQALEVADARHGNADQLLKEQPHAVTAQRYLGADRDAFAQLERSSRALGFAYNGTLAGDLGQHGRQRLRAA